MTTGREPQYYGEGHAAIRAEFFNVVNLPQYVGSTNNVGSTGYTSGAVHNFLIPTSPLFPDPTKA